MTVERYTSYYDAKFARESKDIPTQWVILTNFFRGIYELHYIGPITTREL